jgi:hypothetical protein
VSAGAPAAGIRGWKAFRVALVFGAMAAQAGSAGPVQAGGAAGSNASYVPSPHESAFVDTLEHDTFRWFWDFTGRDSVLTPDREPTRTFSSIAAIGFALTAYPIGAERGYVTRAAAARRAFATLEVLWHARQDSSVAQSSGYRGFYYHFLDSARGTRYKDVELSTIDTALLMAGVLFCGGYFDRRDLMESRIRAVAESLYARVDWAWIQTRPPKLSMGWSPEQGFLPYDWRGYDEAMILHVLALGSTTHPATGDVWKTWASGYRWGTFEGQEHLGFAPLFGHQYSQTWIDFRGIQDDFMRSHACDYFENSRRATLAQRAYAIANPDRFRGYGPRLWGLTACDGPIDTTLVIEGVRREFHTYTARGASFVRIGDDGTIAPCAAAGSIAFAPEIVLPVLVAMRSDYGVNVYGAHGFVDALNPTLDYAPRVSQGRVVRGVGWFDNDRLGIDQGPILAMIENWRSGLVWRVMRSNPHVVLGLERAGFRGGWLDHAARTN